MTDTATLLIDCPDRRGIVAAVSEFLFEHGANITHADQHQDAEQRLFFMRVEWELEGFDLSLADFPPAFQVIAAPFEMRWRVTRSTSRPRIAILVSQYDHCLADLLYRAKCGELRADVALVSGNHRQGEPLAAFYGVPFHHIPVAPGGKAAAEEAQLALLEQERIDLVVLARYMQILSPRFVQRYAQKIINVHHSFLPAFIGAKPYHQAFERGVKLIGATSHYVTEELDQGPIIDQVTARISHRDQLADLLQKGRELEKEVLSRAVRWHVESRILVYGRKTVVFD
ncbi:MAG TPA: formyltetrahydrofolate deformylase [Myxococcales bacterium]|nr:formyltetrahydrofolate deformylase [Myxococcales bacterium]